MVFFETCFCLVNLRCFFLSSWFGHMVMLTLCMLLPECSRNVPTQSLLLMFPVQTFKIEKKQGWTKKNTFKTLSTESMFCLPHLFQIISRGTSSSFSNSCGPCFVEKSPETGVTLAFHLCSLSSPERARTRNCTPRIKKLSEIPNLGQR